MRRNIKSGSSGLTLLEITIGMFILTVGVLSFIGTMGAISKSVKVSKSRTLAANLAQEKIESLKNISYYRLLVTTAPATATVGSTTFQYDNGYYPPEELTVGQIRFTRGVLIQKVTESTGTLVASNWYDADTGLKLITTYVGWGSGADERVLLVRNLRDNPNRLKMDSTFTGTVLSGATPLQDATVVTLQNPLWKGSTNGSGVYSIGVSSGAYELRASKTGYFSAILTSTVAAGASQTANFNLVAMGSGTVVGNAFVANHLLISEVCGAVNSDDMLEYVELYNPTESTFTFSGAYQLDYVRTAGLTVTTLNPSGTTKIVNNTIYPHRFYLLASSSSVAGVSADAYYSDVTLTLVVPANRTHTFESGGIRLVSQGVYETNGTNVDAVGWGLSSGSPYGPSIAREGNGLPLSGASDGLTLDETIERMAYSTSTASTMALVPAGSHLTLGNAYDKNDNGLDWVHHNNALNDVPSNTSFSELPNSGTPAGSALIFIDDGLSSSAIASSTGAFSVPSVATGTWSVLVSSGRWIYSRESSVSVTHAATTQLGTIIINSSSSLGYASGLVKNSGGSPLSSISIETSGGSDTTDSNGYYRLRVVAGTYTIVANNNNANAQYTMGQASGVAVNAGQSTAVSDVILYQGGKLRGFATMNGVDALPGVPIIATESVSGNQIAAAISDSQGYFDFSDLPVATYTLSPQLETGESATPGTKSATVVSNSTVWVGTFTVSNAFGLIKGTVEKSSVPIVSGVFIIAVPSTVSLGSNPPTNNSTLRSGTTVYYSDSSDGEGNYSLSLRPGTYNVYGWYTTFSGETPNVTQIANNSISVTAGNSTTLNFDW